MEYLGYIEMWKVKEARAEDVGFASTISFQTGLRSSDNNDFGSILFLLFYIEIPLK